MTLPAIAAPQEPQAIAPSKTEGRLHRLRILVVEDNHDARKMLRAVLTMDGHEVHEAATGPAGIHAAADLNPEVVILDIGLPGMDGYEVARRLRALPDGESLALVALSGYGRDDDRDRTREAGFDAHLVKPASAEALSEIIAQLVARHEVTAK